MNTDMLFQTVASMTTTMKTSNNQSLSNIVSGSNSSNSKDPQESFKSEMDKAFDRKSSNTKFKDDPIKEKASQKDVLKQNADKSDVNDISDEQQDLAAQAQLQLQNPAIENEVPTIPVVDQSLILGSESVQPLVGQKTQSQSNELPSALAQGENGEEQGIPMPFQSRIDMVKSAMLKEATAQQQEPEVSIATAQTDNVTQKDVESDSTTKNLAKEELIPQSKTDSSETTKQDVPLMVKTEPLDLSKVNIKVADAPVDTTQSNLADQMADKILYKMNEGKQEFDLQLNPKELGKLNIKLTFENGNAQVLITCSNSKAQNMMASLTDNIRGILEANTGLTSTIHLQQEDMLQGQYNQESNHQEGNAKQQSSQQENKNQSSDDLSFMDKLRLGLIDSLEVAV